MPLLRSSFRLGRTEAEVDQAARQHSSAQPLGHAAAADDFANLVFWLLSGAASFITRGT